MTNIKNFFIVLLISLMCFFAVFVKRCDICQEYKKATFENQNIVFAAQIDSKWEYKNNESIFSISTPKHTIALSVDYWKTEADAIQFLESCKKKQMTIHHKTMRLKNWIGEKSVNHNFNQCYFLHHKNYSLFLVTPFLFFTSEIEKFIACLVIIDPIIEVQEAVNVIKSNKMGYLWSFQINNEYNFCLKKILFI